MCSATDLQPAVPEQYQQSSLGFIGRLLATMRSARRTAAVLVVIGIFAAPHSGGLMYSCRVNYSCAQTAIDALAVYRHLALQLL
jgi:hypothetical protein